MYFLVMGRAVLDVGRSLLTDHVQRAECKRLWARCLEEQRHVQSRDEIRVDVDRRISVSIFQGEAFYAGKCYSFCRFLAATAMPLCLLRMLQWNLYSGVIQGRPETDPVRCPATLRWALDDPSSAAWPRISFEVWSPGSATESYSAQNRSCLRWPRSDVQSWHDGWRLVDGRACRAYARLNCSRTWCLHPPVLDSRVPDRLATQELHSSSRAEPQITKPRLEHVSFNYNRLEDEVCNSVCRMLLAFHLQ